MTYNTGWLRAIDEALIIHHLDVANADDDYETAKRKLNLLLCHAQDIGAYFANEVDCAIDTCNADIELKDLQQSLLTFSPPLDTMRSEAEGIEELKAGRH